MNVWRMLVRRHRLRMIRLAMRGGRRLRLAGRESVIARLREELSECPLRAESAPVSAAVFGAARDSAEIAVRQTVLLRFADARFVESLLRSAGVNRAVLAPIPSEWRPVLAKHGFRSSSLCTALFMGQALLLLGAAVRQMMRVLGLGFQRAARVETGTHRAAFFVGLGPDNLPAAEVAGRRDDVVSWYLAGPGVDRNCDMVWHDCAHAEDRVVGGVPVKFVPLPQSPPSAAAYARFLSWCIRATTLAVIDLVRGRWWNAVMLRDAAVAAAFRLQPRHRHAHEYLFNNSGWFYRPLWTYEAEAAGAKVTLYFYSTNVEGMARDGHPAPIGYGWRAASWPGYLVWDEWQERFVRRAVGDVPAVQIVGPVSFVAQDSTFAPPVSPALAVFDVAPVRPSYFLTLGLDSDYYSGDSAISFITDVQAVAERMGLQVLWKRKREFGTHTLRRYSRIAGRLGYRDNVQDVAPGVAAARLIESAAAVVSFPFTSTAIVAKSLRKPSCFYDPTGRIDPDDPAAHGIPVVRGVRQLDDWLEANVCTESHTLSFP